MRRSGKNTTEMRVAMLHIERLAAVGKRRLTVPSQRVVVTRILAELGVCARIIDAADRAARELKQTRTRRRKVRRVLTALGGMS